MSSCNRYMNRKAKAGEAYEPTSLEHLANIVSHALAIPLSMYGFVILLQRCVTTKHLQVAWVYGLATIALFIMSTTYHTVFYLGKYGNLRYWLHVLDRATIYIFIASSYYPWLALRDAGNLGVDMDYVVWFMAILGIAYQYMFHERYKTLETVLYIFMGTFPAISVVAMKNRSGLAQMGVGTFFYLFGVILFKCDGKIPFAHAFWHLHVVLGASIHYHSVIFNLLDEDLVPIHNLTNHIKVEL